MNEIKTFVRYSGNRPSVVLNGANVNPYYFFTSRWLEINDEDVAYFKKRVKRNAAWDMREDEVEATEMKYYARFMGIGKKDKVEEKSTKIKRFERDERHNVVDSTVREYEFPMEQWVEIKPDDKAFFKKKADCNEHWEYEKRIVPVKAPEISKKEKKELEKKAKEEAKEIDE